MATGIVMGPVVTFTRKVDPFGVSEFVAHEVEVTVVGGSEGDEARHFMEGNATVDYDIASTGMHVEIHLFVDEFENKGFSSDKGLVM